MEVNNLSVSFKVEEGEVQAVRNVSFNLKKGETLAIVGESGCGKSVLCKSLMRILPYNGYIKNGEVLLKSSDLVKKSEKEMEDIRGKNISMIFQDPMTSLNPTISIGKQIAEAVIIHQGISKSEAKKRAIELIELVGIDNPEKRFKQFPHHFSGGMRQRIVIAIALACNPDVLIADEPTTALDVTIHDRIAVMYAGKIVEIGTVEDIFYDPRHPYTWGLLGSLPTLDSQDDYLYNIPGMPPNLLNPPKGDAFAIRNKNALKIDYEKEPPMFKINDTHSAATWLLHPDAPEVDVPVRVNCGRVISNE